LPVSMSAVGTPATSIWPAGSVVVVMRSFRW
jgi:hypothetical protein